MVYCSIGCRRGPVDGRHVVVDRQVLYIIVNIFQLIGSFSHDLQGCLHLKWCRMSFIK